MDELLRRQWDQLVAWLRDVDVESCAGRESGVGDWSVGDLVAHLGYGLVMICELEPAAPGTSPISLGRYVRGYAAAAPVIEEQSHELRQRLEPDLVDGIDAMADRAWAALASRRAAVVVGRRGPLVLRDYLATRLIEMVVHADDLGRCLGTGPSSPIHQPALQEVSDVLAAAYLEAAGTRPEVQDVLAWVRAATGRTASSDPVLPVLR